MNYKIYPDKTQTAEALALELYELISSLKKDKVTIAISGGSTPFVLFDIWATQYAHKMDWKKIHFFWVDERCVLPTSEESNFGNTQKVLFDKVALPRENIHRVHGEDLPEDEANRYGDEIIAHVALKDGIPQFDVILLGMGDDGHTASIFPPQLALMDSDRLVLPAQNPYNGQNRITLTGKVINQASWIYFLVTGKTKAEKVHTIFHKEPGYLAYPAAHIQASHGELLWYLDASAGSLI